MSKSRSSGIGFDSFLQNSQGGPLALTCFLVSLVSGQAFTSNIFPAKMGLDKGESFYMTSIFHNRPRV